MKKTDKVFYQGFSVALGTLINHWGEQSLAAMILSENNISITDLKQAGCQPYDLNPIIEAYNGKYGTHYKKLKED